MEKEFVKGIYWNEPSDKAPDFIKGRLSFKVKDAIEYLQSKENQKGYVNVSVKVSRDGRTYLDLDTWEPGQKPTPKVGNTDVDYPEDDLGDGPTF